MVISFFELPEKDRPPEELWLSDDELSSHFDRLWSKDNTGQAWEDVPQIQENELADELRERIRKV